MSCYIKNIIWILLKYMHVIGLTQMNLLKIVLVYQIQRIQLI